MLRFLTSRAGRHSACLVALAFADGTITACCSMISLRRSRPFTFMFVPTLGEPLDNAVGQRGMLSERGA
jgi:hypothetical protein